MSSFTSLSSGGKHVPVRTGVEGMFREDGKNAERFVNPWSRIPEVTMEGSGRQREGIRDWVCKKKPEQWKEVLRENIAGMDVGCA